MTKINFVFFILLSFLAPINSLANEKVEYSYDLNTTDGGSLEINLKLNKNGSLFFVDNARALYKHPENHFLVNDYLGEADANGAYKKFNTFLVFGDTKITMVAKHLAHCNPSHPEKGCLFSAKFNREKVGNLSKNVAPTEIRLEFYRKDGSLHHNHSGMSWLEKKNQNQTVALPKSQPTSAEKTAPIEQSTSGYDVNNLPDELTSLTLIPFPKNTEAQWRAKFLSDNRSNYMNADCQATAYPYLRTAKYWSDIDVEREIVNRSNGTNADLTRESASTVCADASKKSAYRQLVNGHPAKAFDRMCKLLNSPVSFKGDNLTINYQTICINTDYIASSEYESCMKTQSRTTLKTSGLAFTDYCQCSGGDMAKVFKTGEQQINSKTLVSAAKNSRLKCDSAQKLFPGSEERAISSENIESPQSNDVAESLSGTAEDIMDETASTLKDKLKGFGGLFKN